MAGRIARLAVLWCCGLAAIVYVPALWMIAGLGRCFLDGEDSFMCTDVGGWVTILLPIVALPVTLVIGSRAALRDGGRGWGVWVACVAVVAVVGAVYAYLGRVW